MLTAEQIIRKGLMNVGMKISATHVDIKGGVTITASDSKQKIVVSFVNGVLHIFDEANPDNYTKTQPVKGSNRSLSAFLARALRVVLDLA